MSDEEEISISIAECREWSKDLNEKLAEIRAMQGEDAYRKAFMVAFLLQWFADSIDDGDEEAIFKVSKPVMKDLN